jgi:hypothetical protein
MQTLKSSYFIKIIKQISHSLKYPHGRDPAEWLTRTFDDHDNRFNATSCGVFIPAST